MIVRKYEDTNLGSSIEVWVDGGKVHLMITDGNNYPSQICMTTNEIKDLENSLYSFRVEIEDSKKSKPTNG